MNADNLLYGQTLPRALAPKYYTSPGVAEDEVEKIFRREWLCVGRSTDWPAPYDYRAFDLAGEPVVVWRSRNGDLQAFENVCRHRMAVIASDGGNARTLSCPYHKWTYDSTGALRGAPGVADELEGLSICLPRLALEQWQGFVFVNVDANAKPLAPRLTGLDELLNVYRLAEFEWSTQNTTRQCKANWKIVAENAYEGYHITAVHPDTLAPYVSRQASPPPGEYWSVSYEPRKSEFPPCPGDPPGLGTRERTDAYTIGIFPSTIINVDGDTINWFSTLPQGADASTMFGGMSKRSPAGPRRIGDTAELSEAEFQSWAGELVLEDVLICESIQRGMQGAYASGGPLIAEQEGSLAAFHSYIKNQLGY